MIAIIRWQRIKPGSSLHRGRQKRWAHARARRDPFSPPGPRPEHGTVLSGRTLSRPHGRRGADPRTDDDHIHMSGIRLALGTVECGVLTQNGVPALKSSLRISASRSGMSLSIGDPSHLLELSRKEGSQILENPRSGFTLLELSLSLGCPLLNRSFPRR